MKSAMKPTKIICTCLPKEICDEQLNYNGSCKTNSGCFRALSVKDDEVSEMFGCFMDSNHMMMSCNVGQLLNYNIKCCSSHNYCNRNLSIEQISAEIHNAVASSISEDNSLDFQSNPRGKSHFLTTQLIILGASAVFVALSLIIGAIFIRKYLQEFQKPIKSDKSGVCVHNNNIYSTHQHKISMLVTQNNALPSVLSNKPVSANAREQTSVFNHQDKRIAINNHQLNPGLKPSSTYSSHQLKVTTLNYSTSCGMQGKNKLTRSVDISKSSDSRMTSGSGRGSPHLVEQTIARQIVLLEQIGCGRFGAVWRGLYEGESVAVKVFSSLDETSWVMETNLFNMFPLRHENVVGYLTSDITSRGGCTQLWIVMQHHANGSLFDYLQNRTLSVDQALLLAHSAAAGLWYLHSLIVGVQSKPSISHGDVKSKNILVQSNGTCCIADLGLAVIDPANSGLLVNTTSHRMRTIRYMAPELLQSVCERRLTRTVSSEIRAYQDDLESNGENTYHEYCLPLTKSSFETLKAADVYAFGLVLWEIFRACLNLASQETNKYLPPYGEYVPRDPSLQTMHEVVCQHQLRPTIPDAWSGHPQIARCGQLMRECWHEQPVVRLTMLRVKKSLTNLLRKNRFQPVESVNR